MNFTDGNVISMKQNKKMLEELDSIFLKIQKRNYKDSKGNKLSDDDDFKRLQKKAKENLSAMISNYQAYEEVSEKFKKLAVAYCYCTNIVTPLD